jgi:hypothetical protein
VVRLKPDTTYSQLRASSRGLNLDRRLESLRHTATPAAVGQSANPFNPQSITRLPDHPMTKFVLSGLC